jgi:hypothetical protein
MGVIAAGSVVTTASSVIHTLEGLFQGSGFPDQKAAIDKWIAAITADPHSAVTHKTWIGLRCWAGDQSVVSEYVTLFGDASARTAGCGCEVSHGCRAYAAAAVQQLLPLMGGTVGALSDAPQPGQPGGTNPGGSQIIVGATNVPVVASTLSVGGVNIYLLAGAAIVVFLILTRRK